MRKNLNIFFTWTPQNYRKLLKITINSFGDRMGKRMNSLWTDNNSNNNNKDTYFLCQPWNWPPPIRFMGVDLWKAARAKKKKQKGKRKEKKTKKKRKEKTAGKQTNWPKSFSIKSMKRTKYSRQTTALSQQQGWSRGVARGDEADWGMVGGGGGGGNLSCIL